MEEFPSGQREQTVNLSSMTSVVRIHPLPPEERVIISVTLFLFYKKAFCGWIRTTHYQCDGLRSKRTLEHSSSPPSSTKRKSNRFGCSFLYFIKKPYKQGVSRFFLCLKSTAFIRFSNTYQSKKVLKNTIKYHLIVSDFVSDFSP